MGSSGKASVHASPLGSALTAVAEATARKARSRRSRRRIDGCLRHGGARLRRAVPGTRWGRYQRGFRRARAGPPPGRVRLRGPPPPPRRLPRGWRGRVRFTLVFVTRVNYATARCTGYVRYRRVAAPKGRRPFPAWARPPTACMPSPPRRPTRVVRHRDAPRRTNDGKGQTACRPAGTALPVSQGSSVVARLPTLMLNSPTGRPPHMNCRPLRTRLRPPALPISTAQSPTARGEHGGNGNI